MTTPTPNLEPLGWNGRTGPDALKYGASMGRPSRGLSEHFTADDAREEAARLTGLAEILANCIGRQQPYDTRSDDEIRTLRQNDLAEAAALLRMADVGAFEPRKVALRRVRLDSGGYDSGGAYWGTGTPLYWAGDDDGIIDIWFRARDRDGAKSQVKARCPNARFYR